MKYRVVEHSTGQRKYYTIQGKWLLWWNTLQTLNVDPLGFASNEDIIFATEEKAREWIENQKITSRVV